MKNDIKEILLQVLPRDSDLDDSTLEYFESIISDICSSPDNIHGIAVSLKEALAPFLESYGIVPSIDIGEVLFCLNIYAVDNVNYFFRNYAIRFATN